MSTINPLMSLLQETLARVDVLEDRVHDLELALGYDKVASLQVAFGLTENLAELLVMLSDGKAWSKERLYAGLYYRRPEIDAPEIKILDTIACQLRKRLKPHGVEIETVWSSGYRLRAGIEIVRSAIAQDEKDARQRKLERDRERQRRLRRAQGRRDRKVIEAEAISRRKPWLSEGISRATWYSRRSDKRIAANDDTIVQRQDTPIRRAA